MFEILQYGCLATVLNFYDFKVHAIINHLKINNQLNPYYWKRAKKALDTNLNSIVMYENEEREVWVRIITLR